MKTRLRSHLAPLALLVACAAPVAADDPPKPEALIGTWKLVSGKYGDQEVTPPPGIGMLKHVTPTQFMWLTHGEDGTISRAGGGPYTLKGDAYEELPEYGLGADFELLKGKPQTFTCKIEGNRWHHTGKLSNGLAVEEVWERVEKK